MLSDSIRLVMPTTVELVFITLAFITLLLSCFMVYRRFAKRSTRQKKSSHQGYKKRFYQSVHSARLRMVSIMLLNIIAFISLLVLILPFESVSLSERFDIIISKQKTSTVANSELLTEQLIKAEHIWLANDENTISLYQEHLTPYASKVSLFSSTAEIAPSLDVSLALKVYGDGFTETQWKKLPATPVSFLPAPKQLGFIDLSWRKQQSLGESLQVTGYLQRSESDIGHYRIELRDIDQNVLDSVIDDFDNDVGKSFSLSVDSKTPGLFSYQLVVIAQSKPQIKDNKIKSVTADSEITDVVITETISFSVGQSKVARLLVKQSAPSFETRKIKQWASKAGSEVLILTTISQNKTLTQSINHHELASKHTLNDKSQLTAQLLAEFDILVIDTRALFALTTFENKALSAAIRQGLGMLLLADAKLIEHNDNLKNNVNLRPIIGLLNGFDFQPLSTPQQLALTNENIRFAQWPGSSVGLALSSVALNIKGANTQVLVNDENNNALVATLPYGLGQVAVSILPNTYQWGLQGEQQQYSRYWRYLLTQISRNTLSANWSRQRDDIVSYVGQSEKVCLQKSLDGFVSNDIELVTSLLSYQQACGEFRTLRPGWNRLAAEHESARLSTSYQHYFYPITAFPAWQQVKKQRATMRKSSLQQTIVVSEIFRPLDKTIAWLIFILTASLLWIEQKRFSN
jgi:hypothetical protein